VPQGISSDMRDVQVIEETLQSFSFVALNGAALVYGPAYGQPVYQYMAKTFD
jgi:hypothetical protein